MQTLTDEGRRVVTEQASRHGVSEDTVQHLAEALHRSGGGQAQFNLPELGGMGQWQGGMVMVGDMFNSRLKARVDALCRDLSAALRDDEMFALDPLPSRSDWPAGLGAPSAQGSQNDMRYALFPQTDRLAVSVDGQVTLYDTTGHAITGFGQAQGGGQSLSFDSQQGTLPLSALPIVSA